MVMKTNDIFNLPLELAMYVRPLKRIWSSPNYFDDMLTRVSLLK